MRIREVVTQGSRGKGVAVWLKVVASPGWDDGYAACGEIVERGRWSFARVIEALD